MIKDRPVPRRLAVLIAMQNLLAQISTAEGDAFDIGLARAHRGRLLFGADENEHPPAVSIIEAPRPGVPVFGGHDFEVRRDMWPLLIQGITANTRRDDSTDDAYYLVQDVERRLARISAMDNRGRPVYAETHMLGGMITAVEIDPPVVRPAEPGVSSNTFFYLPVRVGIATEIGE